jgi:hypothetical protein
MPFESTQKGMQGGGYRCPYSQAAAFRVFPKNFYGSWRKLQSDGYCGLGNFDRAIELRRFFEVAIGLPLGQMELACQLANCVGAYQLTSQKNTRGVQMLSLFRFGSARHLP